MTDTHNVHDQQEGDACNEPARSIPSRDFAMSELYGALLEVLTPEGIQASNDNLFRAIFGRDSLRVALDLYQWHPSIVEQVLVSLVRLQGTKIDEVSEEEPGRIMHEYRTRYMGGMRISTEQEAMMCTLAENLGWQIEGESLCYYGTVDATPQLVRLAYLYCGQYGREILSTEIRHHDGSVRTLATALLHALSWLEGRVTASDIGLLEFKRKNPKGHRWQVMRDGSVSYLHENGALANHRAPIASLEVQGLAYDAFMMGAELFGEEMPERAAAWRTLAARVQTETFDRFWMEDEYFFAMALDRDPDGAVRQVRTQTSVPAELLDSAIFDTLSDHDRERYIASIVRMMYSDEFLTEVGIRSRAQKHGNILPYWDYQGTYTSWAVTTNVFALGLRRQGLVAHAFDMERRLMNGVNVAGVLPEFFYVDLDGQVQHTIHHPAGQGDHAETPARILATNKPELNQAWTISAVLRAKLVLRDAKRLAKVRSPYESKMKRKTGLRRIGAKLLRGSKIAQAYPQADALVDRDEGIRQELAYINEVLRHEGE